MPQNHSMERGMSETDTKSPHMNFHSILQTEVPKGRDGKHKMIVTTVAERPGPVGRRIGVENTAPELPDSKENIRSALNRATRQRDMEVATSSDNEFLYVWKTTVSG